MSEQIKIQTNELHGNVTACIRVRAHTYFYLNVTTNKLFFYFFI